MNFTNLKNLTDIQFNFSDYNESSTIITNIIRSSDESTQGYLGLIILSILFLSLLFVMIKEEMQIRLDITRSIMVSSSITFILGIVLIITNIITSYVHILWFGFIFLITLIFTIIKKKNNK